jgi:hypothetical protein
VPENPYQQHRRHHDGKQGRCRGDSREHACCGCHPRRTTVHGCHRQSKRADACEQADSIGLAERPKLHQVGVEPDDRRSSNRPRHAPWSLRKFCIHELRRQRYGRRSFQRCQGMGGAPTIAEHRHPEGIPVGIEGCLGETEVQVRAHASLDQLRRQQVEPFVIGKGPGLGIEHQPDRQHSACAVHPNAREHGAFTANARLVRGRCCHGGFIRIQSGRLHRWDNRLLWILPSTVSAPTRFKTTYTLLLREAL